MQDLLFATFLYAAIFCFVCCLRYQPSCAKDAPADWLRSQIVRYLEAHPSIAIAVEELLKVG